MTLTISLFGREVLAITFGSERFRTDPNDPEPARTDPDESEPARTFGFWGGSGGSQERAWPDSAFPIDKTNEARNA